MRPDGAAARKNLLIQKRCVQAVRYRRENRTALLEVIQSQPQYSRANDQSEDILKPRTTRYESVRELQTLLTRRLAYNVRRQVLLSFKSFTSCLNNGFIIQIYSWYWKKSFTRTHAVLLKLCVVVASSAFVEQDVQIWWSKQMKKCCVVLFLISRLRKGDGLSMQVCILIRDRCQKADADRTREQIAINTRLHISVGAGHVIYDTARINRAVCKHQHPPPTTSSSHTSNPSYLSDC